MRKMEEGHNRQALPTFVMTYCYVVNEHWALRCDTIDDEIASVPACNLTQEPILGPVGLMTHGDM
jgi:hypothetical protein